MTHRNIGGHFEDDSGCLLCLRYDGESDVGVDSCGERKRMRAGGKRERRQQGKPCS